MKKELNKKSDVVTVVIDVSFKDDIENVKVQASKVGGQKCQRCWKYEQELIKNEICNRCNDAIS